MHAEPVPTPGAVRSQLLLSQSLPEEHRVIDEQRHSFKWFLLVDRPSSSRIVGCQYSQNVNSSDQEIINDMKTCEWSSNVQEWNQWLPEL